MKTSFINNTLNYPPILIKFALKLFVCKYLSFKTHLLLGLRFPNIKKTFYLNFGIFSSLSIQKYPSLL